MKSNYPIYIYIYVHFNLISSFFCSYLTNVFIAIVWPLFSFTLVYLYLNIFQATRVYREIFRNVIQQSGQKETPTTSQNTR